MLAQKSESFLPLLLIELTIPQLLFLIESANRIAIGIELMEFFLYPMLNNSWARGRALKRKWNKKRSQNRFVHVTRTFQSSGIARSLWVERLQTCLSLCTAPTAAASPTVPLAFPFSCPTTLDTWLYEIEQAWIEEITISGVVNFYLFNCENDIIHSSRIKRKERYIRTVSNSTEHESIEELGFHKVFPDQVCLSIHCNLNALALTSTRFLGRMKA